MNVVVCDDAGLGCGKFRECGGAEMWGGMNG